MTDDCRNDCLERLRFPRVVDNRPGLSHIRYRVGSYADIREYLLRNLDKKPGLSQWTHRGADDPGIALLEGASILGDILTFYQELYANEAYLRTAQWRDSIGDLVRLLGYRLSPGLGGQATFAFEINGNQRVTIPAGFPVKAEVEGLDKPADFETVEPAIAYPWLSKFNVFRPLVWPSVTAETNEFYIETPDQLTSPVALREGDRLLIGVAVALDTTGISAADAAEAAAKAAEAASDAAAAAAAAEGAAAEAAADAAAAKISADATAADAAKADVDLKAAEAAAVEAQAVAAKAVVAKTAADAKAKAARDAAKDAAAAKVTVDTKAGDAIQAALDANKAAADAKKIADAGPAAAATAKADADKAAADASKAEWALAGIAILTPPLLPAAIAAAVALRATANAKADAAKAAEAAVPLAAGRANAATIAAAIADGAAVAAVAAANAAADAATDAEAAADTADADVVVAAAEAEAAGKRAAVADKAATDADADRLYVDAKAGFAAKEAFNANRVRDTATGRAAEARRDAAEAEARAVAAAADAAAAAIADAVAPGHIDNSQMVIVDSTRVLHGMTIVKIKGALKRTMSASSLVAYKIGRTFHHFGYDGPQKLVVPGTTVTSMSKEDGETIFTTNVPEPEERRISFVRLLNGVTQTDRTSVRTVEPGLDRKEFPLDIEVEDVPAGVPFVVQTTVVKKTPGTSAQTEDVTLVRTVANVRSATVTWGLQTAATSVVTLKTSLETLPPSPSGTTHTADIRSLVLHEALSPQLTLKAAMYEDLSLSVGKSLLYYGTAAQAQDLTGRRILFDKPGGTPFYAVVTTVDSHAWPGFATRQRVRTVTLDTKVTYADFPNLNPVVPVYGNLVDATQGKTEAAVPLGNGDNRLVFQTFKVPKAPVTYLISGSDTPPEVPELQIYVNARQWKRVPSFFGRRPDEQIYIVREDADNNSWVQFGDGETGVGLPSGVKNVVARFRTGTGAFGALKAGTKVQAGGKLERLDKIQMPNVAAGGSQPEDGDNARDAAPGKIQSLDRLVSLKDFESETLAISGVTKAAATWQLVDNIPEVVVTVLMATGRGAEISDVRSTLAGYNKGRGPSRFPVAVLSGYRQYVVIDATYGYDSTYREEDVKAAIRKALGVNGGKPNVADDKSGLFSLRQRDFGQREYATSIAGTIQQVQGVTWAYVTRFESLDVIADPTVFTPPIGTAVAESIVACGSQNVLSLYAGHLQIAGVAQTVSEVKQ